MCGRVLSLFKFVYEIFIEKKPFIEYNLYQPETPPGTPPPSRSSSRYNLRERRSVNYADSCDSPNPDSREFSSNDD